MPQTLIRYDWPAIKLLYVAGAGVTEIARSLAGDRPEDNVRIRATVAQRCKREDWPALRSKGLQLAQDRPPGSKGNDSVSDKMMSQHVTIAAGLLADRKNAYCERTSRFIDRASLQLDQRPIESLEDASQAGKMFQPVHVLARDIHGLNAKEPAAALQVNFLGNPRMYKVEVDELENGDPS
jgi:hypothetical protein